MAHAGQTCKDFIMCYSELKPAHSIQVLSVFRCSINPPVPTAPPPPRPGKWRTTILPFKNCAEHACIRTSKQRGSHVPTNLGSLISLHDTCSSYLSTHVCSPGLGFSMEHIEIKPLRRFLLGNPLTLVQQGEHRKLLQHLKHTRYTWESTVIKNTSRESCAE